MSNHLGEAAAEKLLSFVKRIENLEGEKKEIAEDIKEVYAEAKATGYDTKAIRAVIKRRAADKQKLEEQQAIIDVYEAAIAQVLAELT